MERIVKWVTPAWEPINPNDDIEAATAAIETRLVRAFIGISPS